MRGGVKPFLILKIMVTETLLFNGTEATGTGNVDTYLKEKYEGIVIKITDGNTSLATCLDRNTAEKLRDELSRIIEMHKINHNIMF